MFKLINRSAWSGFVVAAASAIAASVPNRDKMGQLLALDRFMRDCVHFRGDPVGLEMLRSPSTLLAEIAVSPHGRTSGDCDEVAMLFGSIVRALGMRPLLVIVARTADRPFHHVHPAVEVVPGGVIPFDPQERVKPGTWTPAAKRLVCRE